VIRRLLSAVSILILAAATAAPGAAATTYPSAAGSSFDGDAQGWTSGQTRTNIFSLDNT
jgi:hypothetical protein